MAFEFYITEFGKAALIHGLAGGSIGFNVIEIGGAEIPPSDFSKVTALADTKLNTKAISQKQIDNTLNLKFQFDNKKVSSDFFWTEIGYFATVTKSDGNTESGMVLYGYNNKETANHIPSYTSNNTLNKYICQIGINYSDELNVTIMLDEFDDYVENSKFTEHLNSENPHGITPNIINAAKSEHCHSANDITSGVLGVERGGTGATNKFETLKNLGIEASRDIFKGEAGKLITKTFSFHGHHKYPPYVVITPTTPLYTSKVYYCVNNISETTFDVSVWADEISPNFEFNYIALDYIYSVD